MIRPLVLCAVTTFLQSAQHELVPPNNNRYMSLSKQELHREELALKQQLLYEGIHWREEKVCGLQRNVIGASTIVGIICASSTIGICCNIPASIIAPCGTGLAYAFDRYYQPDQRMKQTLLKEIQTCMKLKTD